MKEVRRARFKALLEGPFKGDRALVMRLTGLTKGRISQLLDEDKPFGEFAARRLETALRLPPRFFDAAMDSSFSPEALALAAYFDKAPPEEKKILSRLIPVDIPLDVEPEPWPTDRGGLTDIGELDVLKK